MYMPLWLIIAISWLVLGLFCADKQRKVNPIDPVWWTVVPILAPLWFIGAIIRQVIIEDWK